MRIVQVLIPEGKREPVLAVLDDEQIDYAVWDETGRGEFEALAQKLSSLEITISADAGEGGKLFGSVTPQDIADEVQRSSQIEVDKKKIELADPIKVVGEYSVPIKIFRDISASLKVKVVAK